MAQAASPIAASADEIIVTGNRAEKSLAECLARGCPPAEEIEAALRASVEQFAEGRYPHAPRTLQEAFRRIRDLAADLPREVSSLYATLSTVAEHQGDTKLWRSAARNNVQVLRQHMGEADISTLGQELAFADSLIRLDQPGSAAQLCLEVKRKALESNQPKAAAGASFRLASLALMLGRYKEAERRAQEAVEIAGPDNRLMAELRDIVLTHIAIRGGDENAVDALAARLRQSTTERPRLIFSPALQDIELPRWNFASDPRNDSQIRFADVDYWIRPDGRTAGGEVLRDSGIGQWSQGILRHIRGRRYIPLDLSPGDPGIYRIDRFTVRAAIGKRTGSLIAQAQGAPTIHVVDLTENGCDERCTLRARDVEHTGKLK